MLEVKKTTETQLEPTLNMLVYGHPGVGKTTFAATTEKCLIADVENGAVFLGLHGITADVARIQKWDDIEELVKLAQSGGYKTLVIDPLGELLEKLIDKLKKEGYGQGRGDTVTLSLQGWGVAKEKFKATIRKFRDMNINVILIAHSNEKKDEDLTTVRPKLQASLDEDICSMMHAVGYLKVVTEGKKQTRRLFLHPTEKYYAKDRIGILPPVMDDPSFEKVQNAVFSNEYYKKRIINDKQVETFLPEDTK